MSPLEKQIEILPEPERPTPTAPTQGPQSFLQSRPAASNGQSALQKIAPASRSGLTGSAAAAAVGAMLHKSPATILRRCHLRWKTPRFAPQLLPTSVPVAGF